MALRVVVNGDVTNMDVDAVVNAANEQLAPGGGVCGAIFAAADDPRLAEDCRKLRTSPRECIKLQLPHSLTPTAE